MSYLLGIETSCDDTSMAVLDKNGSVLSNVVSGQIKAHSPFGGIVPEIAGREHLKNISSVLELTLKKADIRTEEISGIAATMGPGLLGSLLVGLAFGKSLAYALGAPFYGVNHIEAHLLSPWIEKRALPFPSLILVVSGGHSHLFYAEKEGDYYLISATRDDAAGEAFDKAGKKIGLLYPQGPAVDRLARKGNPKAFKFTMPKMKSGLDFSFSGLKTSFIHKLERSGIKYPITENDDYPDLALDLLASFEKAVVEHLLERVQKAINIFNVKSLALAGGVASNTLLRAGFSQLSESFGFEYSMPPPAYCTDNGAMVAFNAFSRWKKGARSEIEKDAFPTSIWRKIEFREAQ